MQEIHLVLSGNPGHHRLSREMYVALAQSDPRVVCVCIVVLVLVLPLGSSRRRYSHNGWHVFRGRPIHPFTSLYFLEGQNIRREFRCANSRLRYQSQPVTSPCVFPCRVGLLSRGNNGAEIFTTTPMTSILHIEDQSYGKWFRSSEIRFRLDNVIFPAEAASGFTRSGESMRSSGFLFNAYDFQTGFGPATIPFMMDLAGAAERYHYSLLDSGFYQSTRLTVHTSSMTGLFTFSKRTKPVVREYPAWVGGTGFRPMFWPRIPVQFWRRIVPGDGRIVPATRLLIR